MTQPYLSLEAELHDAFWESEDDGTEARLMADFLKSRPGTALEIGCGSGRLMLPLIRAGHDVEGLELSPDMIALFHQHAQGITPQPVIHHGDMCTWSADRRYAALLAPAFTLQLSADPASTLRHWHSLLDEHGGLYLTVFMPLAEIFGDLPENQWYPDHRATLPDGRHAILETRHCIDREKQILHREHRYSLPGSPIHTSSQTLRWFDYAQMISLLENAGFQIEKSFLDFEPDCLSKNPQAEDFDGILSYLASA